MHRIKRFALSLAILMFSSGMAITVPVYAHEGDNSGSGDSSQSSDDTANHEQSKTEIENHAHDLAEQFRTQAKGELAEKKTKVKTQTQEKRQKSCEARKDSLTKRMDNRVTQAKKHKAVFDKIYARVKTFHDTKQLNVTNYDTLVAAADTAQANAQASIDALQSLDVSVDCTSQNVADSVSAFQQAVKSTRDSLKTYRSAITDVIKAVKTAAGTTEPTSTNTPIGQQE
jgi:chromosome segregation ATPase